MLACVSPLRCATYSSTWHPYCLVCCSVYSTVLSLCSIPVQSLQTVLLSGISGQCSVHGTVSAVYSTVQYKVCGNVLATLIVLYCYKFSFARYCTGTGNHTPKYSSNWAAQLLGPNIWIEPQFLSFDTVRYESVHCTVQYEYSMVHCMIQTQVKGGPTWTVQAFDDLATAIRVPPTR